MPAEFSALLLNAMYEIHTLDRQSIPAYVLLARTRLRRMLLSERIDPRLVMVGASVWGQPAGLGVLAVESDRALLIDLYVLPSYRRAGIAAALLAALEAKARKASCAVVQAFFRMEEHSEAISALLARRDWEPPRLRHRVFWSRCSVGIPEWVRRYRFRPPYEVVPWHSISEAEKAWIRARGAEGWYPPDFDPTQVPLEALDPVTSLALRYRGEIVGWVHGRREAPDILLAETLFVDPPLQRLGRGFMLLGEVIRRYCGSGGEHCYCRVDPNNEPMLRWLDRASAGIVDDTYDEWYSKKSL